MSYYSGLDITSRTGYEQLTADPHAQQNQNSWRAPVRLHLTSAQRIDKTQGTEHSFYDISHISAIYECVGVKLVSWAAPSSVYNIVSGYNVFSLRELTTRPGPTASDLTATITVPPGQYTVSTLMSTLNSLLATAYATGAVVNSYVVTLNDATRTFTFTETDQGGNINTTFRLIDALATTGDSRCISRAIGFRTVGSSGVLGTVFGQTSGLGAVYTCPHMPQLDYPSFLYCLIATLPSPTIRVYNAGSSRAQAPLDRKNPHFILPMTGTNGSLQFADQTVMCNQKVRFFPPISNPRQLQIVFYDYEGNAVDFNGCDWQMVLDFEFGSCC